MPRSGVRVWEDYITLPSYLLDGYDPHPLFDELYNKECYPYPLAALKGDRHKKRARYLAVHIENEFLELVCFPHFGGRIYSCRDRTTGHDIFHPVERVGVAFMPAEVGGTYCGCGVEISFPTHHSLTNIRKREYRVLMNPDGSATIVMGELELRMRMRWEVLLTLRPGVARLEQEKAVEVEDHVRRRALGEEVHLLDVRRVHLLLGEAATQVHHGLEIAERRQRLAVDQPTAGRALRVRDE